ncbi:hypothetical protein UPYG_G00198390 [Umbra pygmaea]|uniref:Uncharacterized protein n=1 Tax=Umbra pygmaea TaxID=75934 RepID=A0ABD0WHZ5_UMBPY
MSGNSSLIDSYYTETFGDCRSTAFTTRGGTIFPNSALSTLLPQFSGDYPHFLLRESWEQQVVDPVIQGEGLRADDLSSGILVPVTLPSSDPSGSRSQNQPSTRSSFMASMQPYAVHPSEDVHYHTTSSTTSPVTCHPYMTVSNDTTCKMTPIGTEDLDSALPTHSQSLIDTHLWAKENFGSCWSPCEFWRSC